MVCLVVVAVLVAVLVAALAHSRNSAERVLCASNLRQIGAGVAMYRQDDAVHAYPPLYSMMPPPFEDWVMGRPQLHRFLYDFLSSYIPPDSKVYHCPADDGQVYAKCVAASPRGLGISYWYADNPSQEFPEFMGDYIGDMVHGTWPGFHPSNGTNLLSSDGSVRFSK